jgi:hypothetical protein
MSFSLASIAWIFHEHAHRSAIIWLLAAYMISFAISQGAVIWIYISEIFPNATRSRGQSVGTTTHWVMNAVIVGTFPVLVTEGKWLPFATFAVTMALQFVVAGSTCRRLAALHSSKSPICSSLRLFLRPGPKEACQLILDAATVSVPYQIARNLL